MGFFSNYLQVVMDMDEPCLAEILGVLGVVIEIENKAMLGLITFKKRCLSDESANVDLLRFWITSEVRRTSMMYENSFTSVVPCGSFVGVRRCQLFGQSSKTQRLNTLPTVSWRKQKGGTPEEMEGRVAAKMK